MRVCILCLNDLFREVSEQRDHFLALGCSVLDTQREIKDRHLYIVFYVVIAVRRTPIKK